MKKKRALSTTDIMQRNAADAESLLKLLANAKRLLVLCHLTKGDKSVGELAELVKLSHSALSQHLAKMRELGLVSARKEGKMMFYKIARHEIEAIMSTLYLIYCKK